MRLAASTPQKRNVEGMGSTSSCHTTRPRSSVIALPVPRPERTAHIAAAFAGSHSGRKLAAIATNGWTRRPRRRTQRIAPSKSTVSRRRGFAAFRFDAYPTRLRDNRCGRPDLPSNALDRLQARLHRGRSRRTPHGGERNGGLHRNDPAPAKAVRETTRAPEVALAPCLAQHPLDSGAMDAELGGDGARPPLLDEIVAQELRLAFIVSRHRAHRSAPDATASASSRRRTSPLPPEELADRARTEVTVHRRGTARCASSLGSRFGRHRRARLANRNSMTGECSTARRGSGTVMRHLLPAGALAAPAPVAALALGVTMPTPSRLLIPAARRTQRLAPSKAAAPCTAVLLATITARADEHLAPASGTDILSGIIHCTPRRGQGWTIRDYREYCYWCRTQVQILAHPRTQSAIQWIPRLRRPPGRLRSHFNSRAPLSSMGEAHGFPALHPSGRTGNNDTSLGGAQYLSAQEQEP